MSDARHAVAVIGAGPAGLYAAKKLDKFGCEVVILNRDIRPGGLAEYGIFHDKYKMKSGLRKMFARILDSEQVHYRGNVTVGVDGDLSLDDITDAGFDAVLVAVGAQGIKWLNVDGSEGKNIYDAKQVVYHYNGLPPYSQRNVNLGQRLVIIGAGNVAVDITHWAVQAHIPEITWLVRRGPGQVKYTKKEIGYVGGHIDLRALRAEFERLEDQLDAIGQSVDEAYNAMVSQFGDTRVGDSPSVIKMRFACQAKHIDQHSDGRISGILVAENQLSLEGETVRCTATDAEAYLNTESLVFCVGDAVDNEFGLALNRWGHYAMADDLTDGPNYALKNREGWFAAGWARVASDGLVGKARRDAETGCDQILKYLALKPATGSGAALSAIDKKLTQAGVQSVDWPHFGRIREKECLVAEARGLDDYRLTSNEALLAAAGLAADSS